jgi:DNA invertase Pin-like site-specific DNA recombinase
MSRQPVAYIRRSAPGASISYEEQRAAVVDLAARHGDGKLVELVDAGRSGAAAAGAFGGTRRGGRRRAYQELRSMIADGRVSAVYAYSLSRLARSTRELLDLAEASAAEGVRWHIVKEGTQDFTTPAGRLFVTILAAVSTFEAEVASDRTADRIAAQRERGEFVGRPPFGYRIEGGHLVEVAAEQRVIAKVISTYRSAGTYEATASALNADGIPSPTGTYWRPGTIRRILDRAGVLGPRSRRRPGSRSVPSATFTRLLYCAHCGGLLSPSRKVRPSGEWIGWRCPRARHDPRHPRPALIADAAVRAWAVEEAARLRVPFDGVELHAADEQERAALAERRLRVVDAYESGSISRTDFMARIAGVDALLAQLDERVEVAAVPPAVDWSEPDEVVQPILAALWERVEVDIANRTFAATWRVPEWRA